MAGGYQVSARSDWNSGVMHADWVNCKALIEGDGEVMMVVMPTADVVIEDVWHTAGMRGTGSNTIVVEELFVPAHRVQPSSEFLGNKAHPVHDDEPWASYPFVPGRDVHPLGCRARDGRGRRRGVSRALSNAAHSPSPAEPGRSTSRCPSSGSARRISALRAAQITWHDMVARIIDTCEAAR